MIRPHPRTRHFLAIPDFSRSELMSLFDLAARMKRPDYADKPLAGKTLGIIFAKSSTRTRVSFEVAAYHLGGHALFLCTDGGCLDCSRLLCGDSLRSNAAPL